MSCNGNQTELCGGPDRLNMYQIDVPPPTGWQPQGCYTDSAGARTLAVEGIIPGGPAAMANEACYLSCGAAGYVYSGTEYSGECCECFLALIWLHMDSNRDRLWQYSRQRWWTRPRWEQILQYGLQRRCHRDLRWPEQVDDV
jgi:hypothetical protein